MPVNNLSGWVCGQLVGGVQNPSRSQDIAVDFNTDFFSIFTHTHLVIYTGIFELFKYLHKFKHIHHLLGVVL